ncbi:transcriptional regulator [Gracilibacillus boraciitolerans JCM 21714]|uniref:Transcriptional regulator n=1 Tax=Gracilibacillus boraciitolerans JCM 21714 TaxID=1298598 RepID=W4VMF0_9BACI|nr:AraC family transcriptional regulator [Gracilibacillus boraciitolerans]GAE94371.1 transcriptional regulator [Gracilibacillus boraciitolerans JCM 21714]
MNPYSRHKTYGFRFKGDYQERIAGLHSIGRESQTEHSYQWNGLERREEGRIVFQYTLNGQGAIRIGEENHTLARGKAFMVKIPSDHCYYLPKQSDQWEFVFITIYGEEALSHFNKLTKKFGQILSLTNDANPIKHIFRILEKVETIGINHGYEASAYAYTFLMEIIQYLEYEHQTEENLPVAIAKAMTYIEKNYAKDLTLDDIIQVAGLSKYHFTRLFAKTLNETPIQYVTKIRMQHALDLLQRSDYTIEEIARSVGYSSSNYFSKVFKNLLNQTPSHYRHSKSIMPVDRLFID